jgi:hypothetical protein
MKLWNDFRLIMEKTVEQILPRGSEKITDISLGKIGVKVKTDATPALLKQIRDLVNSKFEEFSPRIEKGMKTEQLAVLVAFNLAEELIRERENKKLLKRRVAETTERLISRVEAHL